jgi:hypothetical protein
MNVVDVSELDAHYQRVSASSVGIEKVSSAEQSHLQYLFLPRHVPGRCPFLSVLYDRLAENWKIARVFKF